MKFSHRLFFLITLLISSGVAQARTFEVGPNQELAAIGEVPWESLQAGDTVLVHWRAEPYQEKWVICQQGTAQRPITVRGVPGPQGQLPVIDGQGAATRQTLRFWNEARGVIKIGGANVPVDATPKHIVIENLDIRSARPAYSFTADSGETQTYSKNAAAIYVEKGENLTIRNCILHDTGNGLCIGSSDEQVTRDVLVEGCSIYDNGIEGSLYEHNVYTAAAGITFQFNHFGSLRKGCPGNNLKDRSSGLVVRYNWIEGGNRQLDLVDGADSRQIRNDPRYRQSFVYGNTLIEPDGAGNRQIVHYGGDSTKTEEYRKGTLFFYNNTIVSKRTDRTTLLRLSTNDERCDFRNNIAYVTAPGKTMEVLASTGVVVLSHNWFKTGWVNSFFEMEGKVNNDGTTVTGESPGFVATDDYHLAAGSPCINAGIALPPPAVASHKVARQYRKHRQGEVRAQSGRADIGAYEYTIVNPAK